MVETLRQKAPAQEVKAEEGDGGDGKEKEKGAEESDMKTELGPENEPENGVEKKEAETDRKATAMEIEKQEDGPLDEATTEAKPTQNRKRKRGEENGVGTAEPNGTHTEYDENEEPEENFIKRNLLLCFAICSKKHSLLPQLVQV